MSANRALPGAVLLLLHDGIRETERLEARFGIGHIAGLMVGTDAHPVEVLLRTGRDRNRKVLFAQRSRHVVGVTAAEGAYLYVTASASAASGFAIGAAPVFASGLAASGFRPPA